MRIIDADALWEKVIKAYEFEDKRGVIGYIKNCIEEAPTMKISIADGLDKLLDEFIFRGGTLREWVEKIEKGEFRAERHGQWSKQMLFDDGFGGARVGYICSACRKYVPFKGNFCGECGAKMEMEDKP